MANKRQPARPKAKATPRRKTATRSRARPMAPSNVNIRKAENGYTISAWDEGTGKDRVVVAKNKAELNKELSKFGIK